jgi:hypothetical protein
MNDLALEKLWSDLPSPSPGELSGLRVPGLPINAPAYVVVDGSRRRQFLVAIADGVEPPKKSSTRGLDISTDELAIGGSPVRKYIRLLCHDPAHYPTFTALCGSIVTAISTDPNEPKAAVVRCLERWRSFWAVDQTGLTREQALGLFGELWFLHRWLGQPTISKVTRWQGPLGARHDFQWPVASVEIKTGVSNSGSSPVHLVASLDQLSDAETGQLYLFSLHVTDDTLAANSLPLLVEQITADLLHDQETALLFSERLAKAGYNPAESGRYTRKLRVLAEELYHVDGSFPRLTKTSFGSGPPAGIGDVSYSLSMDSCRPWRIATAPLDRAADFLRE